MADPSKGDLEVQRRMAEKKAKEPSGRDAAAGVILGGDSPVEESADAETDIGSGTPAHPLTSPVQRSLAREVSFAPPILCTGVKAAVLPNTPNALSVGRRCALPEIWAPDGTPIECTTDEHFVPIVRRTEAPVKAAPVVESAAEPNGDGAEAVLDELARPLGDHEGVAGSGVAVDDLVSSVGYIREVGDSADCRELLKDIERVVQDDYGAGSAEAHDNLAGSAKFSLKKDGAEFEDEEYCTPYAGPQSVEHQALHLPRVRVCFGCDHGKALHQYKRRSKGATLGLTGPDVALKPFGALVHIDWLEMKNSSKAHGIAARALLITDQETEF